jgi:hypothetical protein
MTRVGLALLLVLAPACAAEGAGTSQAAAPTPSPAASATDIVRYDPGPASASGTITHISAGRVLVSTVDGELEVLLAGVNSIWKETEIAASEMELGDQIDVNGTRSGRFFDARQVWVNIGRFDGIVRAFDGATLDLVGHAPRANTFQIELSKYVQLIRGNGVPATVADIRPGIAIGGVMYRPKSGLARATRVWLP